MTTSHGGFLIPNATGSYTTKMAEPDQADFNTLGNSRWGVVSGCLVAVTGTEAAIIEAGIAVVNGLVVNVPVGQSVTLGAGSSQHRFDLIGVNSGGGIVSIPGLPSTDPVYPDVPLGVTLLASVYCPAGFGLFNEYVSDKRNILQPVFVSASSGTDPVLLNRNAGIDTVQINANGRIEWNNSDTYVYRESAATLRVHSNLKLDGTIQAEGNLTVGGNIAATGTVTGSNIVRMPDGSDFPTAPMGTILQVNGRVYIQTGVPPAKVWQEVATSLTANQPGDIKQSMRSPAQMPGWLLMDGTQITELQAPQLFTVDGLKDFIIQGSPKKMNLPNATERILMPTTTTPGKNGGNVGNRFIITTDNMPAHVHNVRMDSDGGHGHPTEVGGDEGHEHTTVAGSGRHPHKVVDDTHAHEGMQGFGQLAWPIVALMWGGANKLDGPINDSSHTYAVEPMTWNTPAASNIHVVEESSEHGHKTDKQGRHAHGVTIVAAAPHVHVVHEDSQGRDGAITFRPEFIYVYTYIKL